MRLRLALLLVPLLILALVLVLWPQLDLAASRYFFDGQMFPWRLSPLAVTLHDLVHPISLALAGLLTLLTLVTWKQGMGWRRWAFVLLALILAPGLVTNTLLKNNSGRARPEQTVEFGGTKPFTPALTLANNCATNCSFVAGDPAFGFWFSTFAYIAPRRRRALFWSGVGIGAGFGLLRLGMGAHFLSDVVFSGLINVAVIALLYRLMFGKKALEICWRDFLKVTPLPALHSPTSATPPR